MFIIIIIIIIILLLSFLLLLLLFHFILLLLLLASWTLCLFWILQQFLMKKIYNIVTQSWCTLRLTFIREAVLWDWVKLGYWNLMI